MNKIYDYTGAMMDLRTLKVILITFWWKNPAFMQLYLVYNFGSLTSLYFLFLLICIQLQTLIPAQLSFKEDCG